MPQYMLALHSVDDDARDRMTEEEARKSWEEIKALNEELRSAGAWVFGGALHAPDRASVVRVSNGKAMITDGPFVESKEHLGGFYIIEAPDLDAALAWAARATAAVRKPIEVRPLRAGEG